MIFPDVVCCSGVFEDQFLWHQREPTLDGNVVATRRHGNEVSVNGVAIETCDLSATNGLVHAVDRVLPEALHLYGRPEEGRGYEWGDIHSFWRRFDRGDLERFLDIPSLHRRPRLRIHHREP